MCKKCCFSHLLFDSVQLVTTLRIKLVIKKGTSKSKKENFESFGYTRQYHQSYYS